MYYLDFAIIFVTMMFFAIPEEIFLVMGLNPYEMSIIPLLLVWPAIFLIVRVLIRIIARGVRFAMCSSKKRQKKFV